ncbi:MAG: hypothetical protein GY941_21450 [Planctomycetes bacterium]|nr:hypothetical protein [Planctomycetota bacterium]
MCIETCKGCGRRTDELWPDPQSSLMLCKKCYNWVQNERDDRSQDQRIFLEPPEQIDGNLMDDNLTDDQDNGDWDNE